jgi:MFS family permease
LFAVLFYIPLLLQQGMGMGLAPFPAGLVLLPQALVLAVLTPISGRLYDRIGPRWLAVIGLLIVAVTTYHMSHITLDTSPAEIMWLLSFRALGIGLCLIPIFTSGVASLPQPRSARAARSTTSSGRHRRRWAWPRSPPW